MTDQRSLDSTERKTVLCLSGGGFRATFFHLGILRYLVQSRVIHSVQEVYSVSGGSLLAAHLALNWAAYVDVNTFDDAAWQVVRLGRRNVRRRLLFGFLHPWKRRTARYVSLLNRFYKHKSLLDASRVAGGRTFHFVTTSSNSGRACAITTTGVFDFLDRDTQPYPLPEPLVGVAVGASSAFPALFNPLELTVKKRGTDDGATSHIYCERLVDGGVYDNLGLLVAQESRNDASLAFIVSDASAVLEWDTSSQFNRTVLGLISRTWRSTDILMRRVAVLAQAASDGAIAPPEEIRGAPRKIWLRMNVYPPAHGGERSLDPLLLDASLREAVAKIRTDLDGFSKEEIKALCQAGYETARLKVGPHARSLGGVEIPPMHPWDPFGRMTVGRGCRIVPWPTLKALLRLRPAELWRLVRKKADFAAPQVPAATKHLLQSHKLRVLRIADVLFLSVLATLAVLLPLLAVTWFRDKPLGRHATVPLGISYRLAVGGDGMPGESRRVFEQALAGSRATEETDGHLVRFERVTDPEDADVYLTDKLDADLLASWGDLLRSTLITLPGENLQEWSTRRRLAAFLRTFHLDALADLPDADAGRRLARLCTEWNMSPCSSGVERGGFPIIGDAPVFLYNPNSLSDGARDALPSALALLAPNYEVTRGFIADRIATKLAGRGRRKGAVPVLVVRGSLADGCLAGSSICLSKELLDGCDRPGMACSYSADREHAMVSLVAGDAVLLPGWRSWVTGALVEQVRRFPTDEPQQLRRWWYLGVAKRSRRPVDAATAILELARSDEFARAVREAGFLTLQSARQSEPSASIPRDESFVAAPRSTSRTSQSCPVGVWRDSDSENPCRRGWYLTDRTECT